MGGVRVVVGGGVRESSYKGETDVNKSHVKVQFTAEDTLHSTSDTTTSKHSTSNTTMSKHSVLNTTTSKHLTSYTYQ